MFLHLLGFFHFFDKRIGDELGIYLITAGDLFGQRMQTKTSTNLYFQPHPKHTSDGLDDWC